MAFQLVFHRFFTGFSMVSGTVMTSHNSLILTPGVADRVGTCFSRAPLKTNDFEAEFTVVARKGTEGFKGDGFAFWYVEDRSVSGP